MKNLLQKLPAFAILLSLACPDASAADLQIRKGRPVVDGVYVNGRGPYRFLLDTGATLNTLDAKIAAAIGLHETFQVQLTTSTGVIPAAGGDGIDVTLDGIQADGQRFLYAGMEAVHRSLPDVQGVLGQIFLSRFDYLLDFRGKRIEFGKREAAGREMRVPFQLVNGRPLLTTSLGALVLDSGASMVTLFGVGPKEVTGRMVTMAGSVDIGMVPATLKIDGHNLWSGDAVALDKAAENGADGLLPAGVFKSVYVCNSEGYLALE